MAYIAKDNETIFKFDEREYLHLQLNSRIKTSISIIGVYLRFLGLKNAYSVGFDESVNALIFCTPSDW